jgi:peptidyl-prolyl cis-trans isomerase A (cyclophilin A)
MHATLQTTAGDIRIELFPNHAPATVKNFTGLATGEKEWRDPMTGEASTDPFYDGLVFHRVIDGFMIQGGCPLGTGTGGPGYTFDDEIHPELHFDEPYLLAMANAGSRPNPVTGKPAGTNGSQFFITVEPTPWLQGKHTIFGEAADQESRAVVDAIAAVPTGRGDKPKDPVVIESVSVHQ